MWKFQSTGLCMLKLNKCAITAAISTVMPRVVFVRRHGTHIIGRRSSQLCWHSREKCMQVMVKPSKRRFYNAQVVRSSDRLLCEPPVCSIDFTRTITNNSAISWRPVLVVEEAGVPGENHRPWASNWSTLSLVAASRVHPFFSTSESVRTSPRQKKILILGAGRTSGPTIEYLNRNKDYTVTVASRTKQSLDNHQDSYPTINICTLDAQRDDEELNGLVRDNDIVVSLLTPDLNGKVASLCIKHRRDMVHNSYLTQDVKDLHKQAEDAGVTILTEIGECPGLDHMLAMKCFDEVMATGGKVTSFVSYCGGIPAPECSDTPLVYKFCWFPLAALKACFNGATFLRNGQKIEIPGERILESAEELNFFPGINLEGLYNQDALVYLPEYGIETVKTMIRGRIRYQGFSDIMQGLVALNLFNEDESVDLPANGSHITWKSYLSGILGKPADISFDSLRNIVYEKVGKCEKRLKNIIDLGLLGDTVIEKKATPIETLCHYLQNRFSYEPNERDMIMVHNIIDVEWPDGSQQRRISNITDYGILNGYSAMSRATGLPTAMATEAILNGEFRQNGVCLPLSPDIYRNMLPRLKREGMQAREVIRDLGRSVERTMWLMNETHITGDKNASAYDELSETYDQYVQAVNLRSPSMCADVLAKYITENRENVEILDIGAGTGLVGDSLYKHGFRLFDGIDSSPGMLSVAEKKKKYRNLYCQFFTAEPTSIKEDTYDAIIMSAAFGKGDVPEESIYEIVRLAKSGCILCFISRKVSLDDLIPYLDKLESEKVLEKIDLYETDEYHSNYTGLVAIYRVL